MQLSIIIVNYNVKHYLYQCLESLRRAIKDIDWEVVVVDNNSSDESLEYLAQTYPDGTFPELHIIANRHNPGFGKANNQAFHQTTGEYVLYINPDTFVCEDTISKCLDFMKAHPDAGCLGVKMHNADGSFAMESRRGIPTPWASFCKITRLSKLFPKSKIFGRYYMQHLPINEPAIVEIISGAFMLVKRDVVSKVGIFDEDFFMYCEDTDLSYRMIKAGYNNYYLPARILHYKGESTRKYSYTFVNTFYKAILIFFHKHYNHQFVLLRIIIYVALYVLGAMSFINRQIRKLHYNIHTAIAPRKTRFLVLTSQDNADMATNLLSQRTDIDYQISTECISEATDISETLINYSPDYIVYDTTLYSYGHILTLASDISFKPAPSIGTFFPRKHMILTNLFIFTK